MTKLKLLLLILIIPLLSTAQKTKTEMYFEIERNTYFTSSKLAEEGIFANTQDDITFLFQFNSENMLYRVLGASTYPDNLLNFFDRAKTTSTYPVDQSHYRDPLTQTSYYFYKQEGLYILMIDLEKYKKD